MGILSLSELKQQYSLLAKKYKLASFESMNGDFEIDKISEETDCILRMIRKVMMEKIVNSISFLELLVNPINTPRIYFSYIKSIDAEERKIIEKIYDVLGRLSLSSLSLEMGYSEEKEAEMIADIYKSWNSIKPDFSGIIGKMKKPSISGEKKDKTYFG